MQEHTDSARGKTAPQSYLLNIYTHPADEKDATLVGTVEKLGNEGKHAFHDIQELLHLLGINDVGTEEQNNG